MAFLAFWSCDNAPVQIDTEEKFAQIHFEEREFDFGTLQAGERVSHIFKFKNTGNMPLIIWNCRGNLVPEWPREPIPPNGVGEIKLSFGTKGRKGKQLKYETVETNAIPSQTKLRIHAVVLNEDD